MKFDVVVGNPPFSKVGEGKQAGKGGINLYPPFYKWAVENAKQVAMVMPTSEKKTSLKEHNNLLSKANIIEYIDGSVFSGVGIDMWYVINNETGQKNNIKFTTLNTNNPLKWERGKLDFSSFKEKTGDWGSLEKTPDTNITIYHKLTRNGLLKKYTNRENIQIKQLFPDSGYAVLMPLTMKRELQGWTDVRVVECNGKQTAFSGMNILFLDTMEQVNTMLEYMKTEDFITQVRSKVIRTDVVNKGILQNVIIPDDILAKVINM